MYNVPSAPSSRRMPPALRFRDFRLLWMGQLVSIAGSQMHVVALHIQMYMLAKALPGANPALYLGAIGLAQFIPLVLFGLRAGVVADRFDRRKVMIITQSLLMGISLTLALLTFFELVTVWVLYAIVAVTFIIRTFDTPSRQALVPLLVPREVLPNALSLNTIAWQMGQIMGPAAGGIIVGIWGISTVYAIDAISFGAVLLSLLVMKHRHTPPPATHASQNSVWEGLRFVRRSPIIWSTMVLDFVATFFGAAMTLLPLFADQVLGVGTEALGWMYAAPAVGALATAIFMATRQQHAKQGRTVLIAVMLYGLSTAVFGMSQWLPLTLLALAGSGAADTVSMVLRGTIRQIATPDSLRGRTTAINMLFFQGGPQLGEVEAGIATRLLGPQAAVVVGGIACIVAAVAIAWGIPALRRYDQG